MATATLTLTDLDLDAGTFQSSLVIEDAATDDGLMTAAHVAAKFMSLQLKNQQFVNQIWAYAEHLVAEAENARIPNAPLIVEAANDAAQAA